MNTTHPSNQLLSGNPSFFSTSTICSVAKTVFSPIQSLWNWIKTIFSCCLTSPQKKLLSLKKSIQQNFPAKPNASPDFLEEYKKKIQKIPPDLLATMQRICIEILQTKSDASYFQGFTHEEIEKYGKQFLLSPLHPHGDVRHLLTNKKTFEENAKNLLLEILDKAMKTLS